MSDRHEPPADLLTMMRRFGRLAELHQALLARHATLNQHLREAEHERLTRIASVAHELRKPLSVIRLLAGELTTQPTRALGETALALDREVTRATRMLDQLITFNQLSVSTHEPEEDIALSALVLTITTQYQRAHRTHSFHRAITHDIRCRGITTHIYAILENLLDNAVRHTQPGTRITTRLTVCDDIITLIVTNADRAPKKDHAYNNALRHGLGLAIVTHAAQQLGGTFTLQRQSTGVRAIVTFPHIPTVCVN